jgi:hypothetical protein
LPAALAVPRHRDDEEFDGAVLIEDSDQEDDDVADVRRKVGD